MPRLTKIYTKKGDSGETSLGSKTRVPKNDLRVEAFGSVDELNAFIGLALAGTLSPKTADALGLIQNLLFHLGSELAFPADEGKQFEIPQITEQHINNLETYIDEINQVLGPLDNFILPRGTVGAASLHVARTVCRRAERQVVGLAQHETVSPLSLAYLNRLSDALFMMARYENFQQKIPEKLWDSHA